MFYPLAPRFAGRGEISKVLDPGPHLDFKAPQPSWHGDLPITGDGGRCVIEVQQYGLIGTTQFAFDRDD